MLASAAHDSSLFEPLGLAAHQHTLLLAQRLTFIGLSNLSTKLLPSLLLFSSLIEKGTTILGSQLEYCGLHGPNYKTILS